MLNDFRLAFRTALKTPGFSGVVILVLGLAIGANTAIFSVLNAVLVRPLPMHEPERLVRLYEVFGDQEAGGSRLSLSPQTWHRWREANTVFTDIARATAASLTLGRADGAERFATALVSHNFFGVLGVRPILGRDFTPADDTPGAPRVVLVGHGFWRDVLGGAADAVGRTLVLDGQTCTVVGVMPRDFRHPYRAELWTPFAQAIDLSTITGRFLYAPARLKPGVTPAQATAAMRETCARLNRESPLNGAPTGAAVLPLHSLFVADLRPKLLAITCAAAFVLLIAGSNVAGLLLGRHVEREGDAGIRLALGASRFRLVRESLAHTLLLTLAGCAAGVLLAAWLVPPLVALSPLGTDGAGGAMREFPLGFTLNFAVLGWSVGAALVVGLGFGLLPALRSSRTSLDATLRGRGRSGLLDPRTRHWLRLLVAGEVAVAVVLLSATGLLVRSFRNLVTEPWGYAVENRLAVDVTFTDRLRPEHAQRIDYVERALERLRTLPGVRSVYATTPHQMFPAFTLAAVSPEGTTPPADRGYYLTYHRTVMPGYFRDSGVRIVRGRAIDETDRPGGPPVAVVSETFAKRMWPDQEPIGRTIRRGRATDPRPPYVVVGVASDRKAIVDRDDGDVVGQWYLPFVQSPNYLTDTVTFVIETATDPAGYQATVRAELGRIDPALAPYGFNSLDRMVGDSYLTDRFALVLVAAFGGLGLILAVVGLYGQLSFQVARQSREIGVRTALGAATRHIVGMVLREGALLVGAGLAAGLVASVVVQRALLSQLHAVGGFEPLAHVLAPVLLAAAALLAVIRPAIRAARVDPLVALRSE